MKDSFTVHSEIVRMDSFIAINNNYALKVKCILDFVFSLLIIVFVFSWLAPIMIVLIRLTSKGPGIFKQERIGYNGEIFTCYKFRTMYLNLASDWLQCEDNDARVTKIGYFLRKTHIDELPQLVNVLKGEMSLVGPRPHMLAEDIEFSSLLHEYKLRRKIKPGITGLAQVKGYFGATHNDSLIKARVRMDLFYLKKISFLLDLRIVLSTILLPFSK